MLLSTLRALIGRKVDSAPRFSGSLNQDRTLPEYVTEVLSSALFHARDNGDEEAGPRIMVVLAGGGYRGAFFFSREEATKRLQNRWPELTEEQLGRAVSMLEAGAIKARVPCRTQERKGWVFDY